MFKKYNKVLKEDYEKWYAEHESDREETAKDPMRLKFHLMPKTGWLNDPNGLCQFHGTYHIYYQYTPFEPTGELKLWGHYTTKDFISYIDEGPVLFPDSEFDAHGVYSGSAFVKGDTIHYFYTGNIKYFDRDDYDYINSGRGSNTIHVASKDGYHFSEKDLLMTTDDYPEDMSCHVRDPKIIRRGDDYYMVQGARDIDSHGLILMFHSKDLSHWEYFDRIVPKEPFGYMWECPDLFELDGQMMLITCPQGVEPKGIDYQNVHQCTAVKMDYDFENKSYEICDNSEFQQLDRGFDFYAPQTFEDEKGRRILIGWMGIPDADYTNPTVEHGWQHALTIPRELHIKDGRIIQQPIKEMEQMRKGELICTFSEQGRMESNLKLYEAEVRFRHCADMVLTLKEGVTLSYDSGLLTLDLGDFGAGRTTRCAALDELKDLRIFADTTSLEIFVNGGEEVFTTRVYSSQGKLSIDGDCSGTMKIYCLRPLEIGERE